MIEATTANLFDAIRSRNVDLLSRLLEAGADANSTRVDWPHWTALGEAIDQTAEGGPVEAVVLLLRSGADPDGRAYPSSTPLLHALFREMAEIARMLLARGADPNCEGDEGDSPLRWCVQKGDYAMVSLLLHCGATKSIDRAGGQTALTPLGISVRKLDSELVALLLRAGADPNALDDERRRAIERLPPRAASDEKKWVEVESLLREKAKG